MSSTARLRGAARSHAGAYLGFQLVALALFQVILASNLTDSVLFPPLLVLFLPTAVWTLLVHTLRTEAQEAGDPTAASRALTPGLMGVTLAASGASIEAVASVTGSWISTP